MEKKSLSVMVNNSTNIYKTNNHLSRHITEQTKKTTTYGIGNPGPGFGQASKMWLGLTN
jgi:hypothetical protein